MRRLQPLLQAPLRARAQQAKRYLVHACKARLRRLRDLRDQTFRLPRVRVLVAAALLGPWGRVVPGAVQDDGCICA
jgi:hypothetical protein